MYVLNDNADHCLSMGGTQTWVLCSDFAFRFYFPILFHKKKTNTKKSQEDKSASSNFEKKQDNLWRTYNKKHTKNDNRKPEENETQEHTQHK